MYISAPRLPLPQLLLLLLHLGTFLASQQTPHHEVSGSDGLPRMPCKPVPNE
jgi:hypothetical protein